MAGKAKSNTNLYWIFALMLLVSDDSTSGVMVLPESLANDLHTTAVSICSNNDDNTYFRLRYSKKGWTNGEIGAEWVKHFDQLTQDKAKGCYRVLLVDGHNSHYTRPFLQYAREHKIHVLYYLSHGTHMYQGLDVAVFSSLKREWAEESVKWEREKGEKVTKSNFLAIYIWSHPHLCTAT